MGLEGVVVDHDRMAIGAFENGDARSIETRVAGPAALLVAKVHKISERAGSPRQKDKDALDVLRLLRGTTSEDLAERLRRLQEDESEHRDTPCKSCFVGSRRRSRTTRRDFHKTGISQARRDLAFCQSNATYRVLGNSPPIIEKLPSGCHPSTSSRSACWP
jgi:hypothetical protein